MISTNEKPCLDQISSIETHWLCAAPFLWGGIADADVYIKRPYGVVTHRSGAQLRTVRKGRDSLHVV